MKTVLEDGCGSPLILGGVLVPWNVRSVPRDELGGRAVLFRPGSFDDTLRAQAEGRLPLRIDIDHQRDWTTMDRRTANIEMWNSHEGLMFEVSGIDAGDGRQALVAAIARGEFTGVSIGVQSHAVIEGHKIVDGVQTQIVSDAGYIYDFCVCNSPAFPTSLWVTSDNVMARMAAANRTVAAWMKSRSSIADRCPPAPKVVNTVSRPKASARPTPKARAAVPTISNMTRIEAAAGAIMAEAATLNRKARR